MAQRPRLTQTAVDGLNEIYWLARADYESMSNHPNTHTADHRAKNVKRGLDYLEALIEWHQSR